MHTRSGVLSVSVSCPTEAQDRGWITLSSLRSCCRVCIRAPSNAPCSPGKSCSSSTRTVPVASACRWGCFSSMRQAKLNSLPSAHLADFCPPFPAPCLLSIVCLQASGLLRVCFAWHCRVFGIGVEGGRASLDVIRTTPESWNWIPLVLVSNNEAGEVGTTAFLLHTSLTSAHLSRHLASCPLSACKLLAYCGFASHGTVHFF